MVPDAGLYDSNKLTTRFAINFVLDNMDIKICDDDDPINNYDMLKDEIVLPDNARRNSDLSVADVSENSETLKTLRHRKKNINYNESKPDEDWERLSSDLTLAESDIVPNYKSETFSSTSSFSLQRKRKTNDKPVTLSPRRLKRSRQCKEDDSGSKNEESDILRKAESKHDSISPSENEQNSNFHKSPSSSSTELDDLAVISKVFTDNTKDTWPASAVKDLLKSAPTLASSTGYEDSASGPSTPDEVCEQDHLLLYDFTSDLEKPISRNPTTCVWDLTLTKCLPATDVSTLDLNLQTNTPFVDSRRQSIEAIPLSLTTMVTPTENTSSTGLSDFIHCTGQFNDEGSNTQLSSIDYLPLCLY